MCHKHLHNKEVGVEDVKSLLEKTVIFKPLVKTGIPQMQSEECCLIMDRKSVKGGQHD